MQTVDLVESFVNSLSRTVTVLSQITSEGIITAIVDDSYWLTVGDVQEIDGKKFTIVSIEGFSAIQFEPEIEGDTIDVDTFEISAPTFYHGTLKMTKNEVNKSMSKETITPMVYLREPITERKVYAPGS